MFEKQMKVLIVAGGTGGHIFPGLSIAEELTKQKADVHWLGSQIGLEGKIVAPHYPLHQLSITGVRGKGFLAKLFSPLRLTIAVCQAIAIMLRLKPDLVFAVGGFVSCPGGIAAWLLRIPLIIHESNAVAGLTNRILAKFATRVLSGFPNAFAKTVVTQITGNPVRPAIAAMPIPEFRYKKQNKSFRLLIMGGSQGARALNRFIPNMLNCIPAKNELTIWHQTGQFDFEDVKKAYAQTNLLVKLTPFIDNIVEAYYWADLVICRSGAMTVSEIAAAGVPAILIPFPFAVDDHQYYNALYLVSAGAALVVRQNELNMNIMATQINALMHDREHLLSMAEAARERAHPNALAEIISICFQVCHKSIDSHYPNLLQNPLIKHIHCMGIGGVGVSGIAEILLQKGYKITGSDITMSPALERLRQLGAEIIIGHKAKNVATADAVIFSSAINKNNPEFMFAKTRNIPVVQRGKILAELMQATTGIAVAGTHGKTTTSCLLAHCFLQNAVDVTYVVGGVINQHEGTAHLGTSDYFIAEADESDASFLYLQPKYAIVTNIEADHLEAYQGSFNKLKKAFIDFLNNLPKNGVAILCIDDAVVRDILPMLICRTITYGFSEDAAVRAHSFQQQGLHSMAEVVRYNRTQPLTLKLNLPGRHNMLNALSIIALATALKLPDDGLLNALQNFPGVLRRFYAHGEISVSGGKALLFEDYGHHPSEIKVTLEAAREAWPNRRIVLVFQPHRYTRTKFLMQDFAQTLRQSDLLFLLDVYSAGENKIDGADSVILQRLIAEYGEIKPILVPKLDDLPPKLKKWLKADDVVIFQGAGSIGPYAHQVVRLFNDRL